MVSEDKDNSTFSFYDEEENDDMDFTFSDIPVLGQDPKDKGEGFSFESFKPNATVSKKSVGDEHLDAFTQMLSETDGEEGSEGLANDEHLETTQQITPEFLDSQKAKWQKITKNKGEKSKVPIIAVSSGIALMLIATAAYLLIPSGDSSVDKPVSPPVKTPEKKPVKDDKTVTASAKKTENKVQENPDKKKDQSGKNSDSSTTDKKGDDIKIVKTDLSKNNTEKNDSNESKTNTDGSSKPKNDGMEYDASNPNAVIKKKEVIKPFSEYYRDIFKLVADDKIDKATELTFEMFEKHPGKYDKYVDFQNKLIEKKYDMFAVNIFQKVFRAKPHSPQAAFLYGKALGKLPSAETYLKKALFIQRDYLDAYVVLGAYYFQKREWDKAADLYSRALKYYPSKSLFRNRFVVCKLRKSEVEGKNALIEYEKLLLKKGLDEYTVGAKLIGLAQMFSNPDMAKKYLGMMRTGLAKPSVRKEYAIALLKQKAIYSTVKPNDFKKLSINDVREEYIVCLLSNDLDRQVMTLTTPPKYFPDFWKSFLSWKYSSRLWGKSAQMLNDKHRNSEDQTIYLITSLWLGKISATEARDKITLVDVASEPLYYMLIAEYYRKKKQTTKARVMYNKALKNKFGIYYNLIKHYRLK